MSSAAPVSDRVQTDRLDYARDLFRAAASELSDTQAGARQLTGLIAVLVALEANVFARLTQPSLGWDLLPLSALALVIVDHLRLFNTAVKAGFIRAALRPPAFLKDLEHTTRAEGLGMPGLIEDEYVQASWRARIDANRLRENIAKISGRLRRSALSGITLTVGSAIVIRAISVAWALAKATFG